MDREVRAGENPTAPAPPTHMPVQKMGPQDDPEAFLDLLKKTAAACGWPQTDWPVRLIPLLTREAQLAAAAAASPEPPGLRRPKTSHPPVGRPEPRAAPPALPFAGAGGEALRDGSPAPGRRPQMAVGRGRRRRPNHRPGGAGAIYCAAP